MGVRRMDHVGIVVEDLAATIAFFHVIGLETEGEWSLDEEPWVGNVIGLTDVRIDNAMLKTPDGHSKIELSSFRAPKDELGPQVSPSNRLGLRHITFAVDDLDDVLKQLSEVGYSTVGQVEQYQDIYRLCFVRGPEGIIVELAEELG